MASEIRVNRIVNTAGIGTAVTFDSPIRVNQIGSASSTAPISFTSDVAVTTLNGGPISGARNRLNNADMRIDQRNAGAAISLNNNGAFSVDRWLVAAQGGAGTGTASVQRVVDAPPGFVYSLRYTVTNAKTPAASDAFYIYQPIEGQNIQDFAYGTSSAKTVTLSFWVKSSLSGIFSGFLRTQTAVPVYRSYVFNYTINSPNVWEYKTITILGDNGMIPALDNTGGMGVLFDMGSGSTAQTSILNSWQSGNFYKSTGSVSLISTNSATFQVTGVQLELGSTASAFETRLFNQELDLCQRYYEKSYNIDVVPGSVADAGAWESVSINVVDFYDYGRLTFKTRKRTTPVLSLWSTNGIAGQWRNLSANVNQGNSGANNISETGAHLFCTNSAMTGNNAFRTQWVASAELA